MFDEHLQIPKSCVEFKYLVDLYFCLEISFDFEPSSCGQVQFWNQCKRSDWQVLRQLRKAQSL